MKYRKEIQQVILYMLAEKLDLQFANYDFRRNRKSLEYRRWVGEAQQVIAVQFESHPSFQPDADAFIYPWLKICIPSVNKVALQMVRDPKLIDNGREETFSQPMEMTAPKGLRQQWYVTGEEQILNAGSLIGSFIEQWVIPFLNDYASPEGIIHGYECGDERPLMDRAAFVRVAAAYVLLKKPERAKHVLDQKLGRPVVRKEYASAFEFVESMLVKKSN